MLVSVIITIASTENRLDLLKSAIESVCRQTYHSIELVIVQDGPGFQIPFLAELNTKIYIHVINTGINKGPSYARNFGVKFSNGIYLAFLDSDDEWMPEKIELQIREFKNNQVGAVGNLAYSLNCSTGLFRKKNIIPLKGNVYSLLLRSGSGIQTSMLMVRRDVFYDVGGFDEDMFFSEEKDLQIRISKLYNFGFVNRYLGVQKYNHSSTNLSLSINHAQKGVLYFLSKWRDEVKINFGSAGVNSLNKWLYAYLVNCRKLEILHTKSTFHKLKILIGMYKNGEIKYCSLRQLISILAGFLFTRRN